MNYIETGKTYSLSEIFHGENNKVVIPDLQRDYCWSNPEHNLVVPFVLSLIDMDKGEDVTMGLIYGYYDKLVDDHLQLCDGQQRLTTLFLLLGVINRLLANGEFQRFLMSDFELNEDDHEPYLQYAIRESSLYFLSDLTYYYFLGKGERIASFEDIRKQPWFLSNYRLDPTVNSILSAIESIEELLKEHGAEQLREIGLFVVTKIKFLFYDMGDRMNGEETFVVINTTGEPLSATQNLKPLAIEYNQDEDGVAEKWEEIETWFWRNRHKSGTDYPHTADEGMACFLNVVRLLYSESEKEAYMAIDATDQFPYKKITFGQIYSAFHIYQKLKGIDFSERKDAPVMYPKNAGYYTQRELYAIVPTMWFCLKFNAATDEDIKRIYHLFSNITRYNDWQRYKDKKGNEISPTFQAMRLVEGMSSPDYLCLRDSIKDEEIIAKMEMVSRMEANSQRKELELLFAEAEAADIFNGEIAILVSWSGDLEQFRHYWNIFKSLFDNDKDGYTEDIVRRAIIASSWPNYPISTCYFGYKAEEWRNIIEKNELQFRQFLDEINEIEWGKIKAKLENKIAAMPEGQPWREFAVHPELLEYCNTKHLYKSEQFDEFGWMLIQNQWARPFSANNMLLFHDLNNRYASCGWKIWQWASWDSCVVLEKEKAGVAIDIRCLLAEEKQIRYSVEVFERDNEHTNLVPYRHDEFTWEETKRGGIITNVEDKQLLFKLIDHCIAAYNILTKECL